MEDGSIYKPLSRSDVLELQAALDMAQDLPQTLVQAPDMNQLQNFVDRMKHVGDVLNVSIRKSGDLHLQISTTLVTLGAEFRKLVFVGEQAAVPPGDENLSAQIHSRRAIERGDAMSVQVSVKHFFKSLQCHLAKPDCAFYGIGQHGSCLTVVFQLLMIWVLVSGQRKRFLALTELRFELLLLVSSSSDFHLISISLLSLEIIFVW
ncbi:hypothetical protein L2E82_20885 [Cichorium intybus]|uniref:Uncharacterized protein n=1 Tax=Cichorium intybus TaxID=13427 RepID=A0ACB9DVE4_CICIN|nr:hypothetical protein L2E82_20885 [Cichorium intybus]